MESASEQNRVHVLQLHIASSANAKALIINISPANAKMLTTNINETLTQCLMEKYFYCDIKK